MQETKDGKPTSEPYYFGYTTNQTWANQYCKILVDKASKDKGISCYTSIYTISKVSQEKFHLWQQEHGMLEEIVEWPGGIHMTNSDYEYYVDTMTEDYDSIMAMLNGQVSSSMPEFIEYISNIAKYSTSKTLKYNVRTFKKLIKYMKAYFGDYELVLENLDLEKIQRKL